MKELKQSQSNFADAMKKESLPIFNSIPTPKEKLDLQKFLTLGGKAKISAAKLSKDLIERGVILTDINTALEEYPPAQEYFSKNLNAKSDKFNALNLSFFVNGIFLYVPKNIELEEPVRVNFSFNGATSVLHNLIIAESNSKIDFIEEYSNNEAAEEQLNSCVTEVFANDSSKISFCHLNRWTKNVYNFTNIIGALEKNASLKWASACFGGRLNRLRIDTNFNGNGSQCSNIGLFLGKGKERIDFTTNAYHNTQNTTNDILIDGILKDESSSAYRGLIKIEKQAQKTNSHLKNHILKLGEKTLANSIPSLKIDANDVRAGHGATVGQINEEHLFYLMARGLPRLEAERLIIEGFFEPVIQRIPLKELREKIRQTMTG